MEYKDIKDSPSTKISKSTRDHHVWDLVCRSGFISHKDTPASTCKWIRKYVYEYVYARQLFQITICAGIDIINVTGCARCGERRIQYLYFRADVVGTTELYCKICVNKQNIPKGSDSETCAGKDCHKFGSRSNMFRVAHKYYYIFWGEPEYDVIYDHYCNESCYIPSPYDVCPYCHKGVWIWYGNDPERKQTKCVKCDCGITCTTCNTIVNVWRNKGPRKAEGKEFFECNCGVTCKYCNSYTSLDKLDSLSCICSYVCGGCDTVVKYDVHRNVEFCDCGEFI